MEKGDFLDVIIDSILDRGTEAPKFVRDCEKKLSWKYTGIQTGSGWQEQKSWKAGKRHY